MEDNSPDMDEGWWASVLADEEAYAAPQKNISSKPSSSNLAAVDWKRVQDLYENDEFTCRYRGTTVVVDCTRYGIQGFVPVSHLVDMPCNATEEERRQVLNDYVGRTFDLKVIECEPSQERIVLSERAALAGQGRRRQLFNTLRPGELVHGTVTNVTDFGVFVDLGGLEGLISLCTFLGRVRIPLVSSVSRSMLWY
jgi:small subunit ribosomal protein S1